MLLSLHLTSDLILGCWPCLESGRCCFTCGFTIKKNKKCFIAGWGFLWTFRRPCGLKFTRASWRRLKVVGVNWEEVQEQREHSVPFLHVGAEKKKIVDTLCLCAPLLNDLVCDASRTCVRLNSFWLPLAIKQGAGLLHPFLCLKFSPRCFVVGGFFSVKRTSSLINVSSLIFFFCRSSLM